MTDDDKIKELSKRNFLTGIFMISLLISGAFHNPMDSASKWVCFIFAAVIGFGYIVSSILLDESLKSGK